MNNPVPKPSTLHRGRSIAAPSSLALKGVTQNGREWLLLCPWARGVSATHAFVFTHVALRNARARVVHMHAHMCDSP